MSNKDDTILSSRVLKALESVKNMTPNELKKEAKKATPEKLRLLMFRENHKNETLH